MKKDEMIREIKKYKDRNGKPYNYVNVMGGRIKLEDAPVENIWAMHKRLMNKPIIRIGKVRESQFEFDFLTR